MALTLAGCGHGGHDPDDQPATGSASTNYGVEVNAAGENVVHFSATTQQLIGLKTAPVEAAQLKPSFAAFGTVLDPGPLIALQGDLAAAEASLGIAKTLADRARALYQQDETVSKKALESAENDEQLDQIKLATLRRTLELNWGDAIAKLDPQSRQALVDGLASRRVVLARVDLPLGESLATPAAECQLAVDGTAESFSASLLSSAPTADPKILGQGFFVRVDSADESLAPGQAVRARMGLPGAPLRGVKIPDAAVVRAGGKTWVYVPASGEQFARREVRLDAPMDGGWFSTNGLAPGEKVVVQGAEILLSEEEKAQIKGGD